MTASSRASPTLPPSIRRTNKRGLACRCPEPHPAAWQTLRTCCGGAQAQVAPAGVAPPVVRPARRREPQRDQWGRAYATGPAQRRRRPVWIKPGKGEITVNDKKVVPAFAPPVLRMLITHPFLVLAAPHNPTMTL